MWAVGQDSKELYEGRNELDRGSKGRSYTKSTSVTNLPTDRQTKLLIGHIARDKTRGLYFQQSTYRPSWRYCDIRETELDGIGSKAPARSSRRATELCLNSGIGNGDRYGKITALRNGTTENNLPHNMGRLEGFINQKSILYYV